MVLFFEVSINTDQCMLFRVKTCTQVLLTKAQMCDNSTGSSKPTEPGLLPKTITVGADYERFDCILCYRDYKITKAGLFQSVHQAT